MASEFPQRCVDGVKNAGGAGCIGSCQRVSPTTPTISIQGDRLFTRKRRPRGDSPEKAMRASVWLMMATAGCSSVSVPAKSRPARSGIASVLK